MKLLGKDLIKVLEHGILNPDLHFINAQFSGVHLMYNPQRPFGHRILSLTVDSAKVKLNKIYSVGIIDFMLHGGDGYNFKKASKVVYTPYFLRDTIINYIKTKKVVSPNPIINHVLK